MANWIERAVRQKPGQITLDLAHSKELILQQDKLGKKLGLILPNETNHINWN